MAVLFAADCYEVVPATEHPAQPAGFSSIESVPEGVTGAQIAPMREACSLKGALTNCLRRRILVPFRETGGPDDVGYQFFA